MNLTHLAGEGARAPNKRSRHNHPLECQLNRFLLQAHPLGSAVVNPIEKEFKCPVRLGPERDLRAKEHEPPLADRRIDHGDTVLKIFLPPRPAASEWFIAIEPCDWLHLSQGRLGPQSKHRAVVEEDIELFVDAISQRICIVHAHLENRSRYV